MIKDTPAPSQGSPADQTRIALLLAALRLFGKKGFDGTSTREIAAAAKANIGSIAYHFGGKEGLRVAAADHIVNTFNAIVGPLVGHLDPAAIGRMPPDAARQLMVTAVDRFVGFIVAKPEAGEIVQFVLRELAQPTAALDRIYSGMFEPSHRRLCAIWAAATGADPDSEQTRLTVFTLIGQAVYFRIAREAVQRRMGWAGIGPSEAAKVTETIKSNVEAILAFHTDKRP